MTKVLTVVMLHKSRTQTVNVSNAISNLGTQRQVEMSRFGGHEQHSEICAQASRLLLGTNRTLDGRVKYCRRVQNIMVHSICLYWAPSSSLGMLWMSSDSSHIFARPRLSSPKLRKSYKQEFEREICINSVSRISFLSVWFTLIHTLFKAQ
jgi:hypothetical protein